MEFKKLEAPSLKDLFIREIEYKILSGELEVGDQLPTERELAEEMGVNRNIVRAGIASLAQKGFLTVKPRVGAFVADYMQTGGVDVLLAMMNYNGGFPRRSEVRAAIELKILFDTFAIRRMEGRVTAQQLDALWKLLEQLRACERPADAASVCFAFFHTMSGYSGNTILPLIYGAFRPFTYTLFLRHIRRYGVKLTADFAEQLFVCLSDGRFEEAAEVLTAYYQRSIDGDLEIYEE